MEKFDIDLFLQISDEEIADFLNPKMKNNNN